MSIERKKEQGQIKLQTVGKETAGVNDVPSKAEKTHTRKASLTYKASNRRRQYFNTRSRKQGRT